MALIKCTECSCEISDRAAACPHCGAPMPSLTQPQTQLVAQGQAFKSLRATAGVAFFGGLAWLFFAGRFAGNDGVEIAWSPGKWVIGFGVALYVYAEIARNLALHRAQRDGLLSVPKKTLCKKFGRMLAWIFLGFLALIAALAALGVFIRNP